MASEGGGVEFATMEKDRRDPLTKELLDRLTPFVEAWTAEHGESVYALCEKAGLNRRWYDDVVRDKKTASPTIGKLHALMDALGITIYDLLDRPRPTLDVELLQEFIEEALKYKGALSPQEVARVVARAYARHPSTGMTPQELNRYLDLIEPEDVRGVSH